MIFSSDIFYKRRNICQLSFCEHYLSFSPSFSHTNMWTTPKILSDWTYSFHKIKRGHLKREINFNESIWTSNRESLWRLGNENFCLNERIIRDERQVCNNGLACPNNFWFNKFIHEFSLNIFSFIIRCAAHKDNNDKNIV